MGRGLFTDGVTAGLFVESEPAGSSNATLVFWGVTHAGRPERTFGKMFSHYVAQTAGGRVFYLGECPRLCGDVWPLLEAADAGGFDIVFVGRIDNWRQNYILFFQWAAVRFSLTCYAVPEGDLLWEADVSRRGWYSTHRDVFVRALNDLFRARR